MTKARKLSSGTWNVRVLAKTDADGTRHYKSFTADTKAEVLRIAAEYEKKVKSTDKRALCVTVGDAVDRYIQLCDGLSPTTVHAYERIRQYAFSDLMEKEVADLDDETVQAAVNIEARRKNNRTGEPLSAKTVKNEWDLVSTAIRTICGQSFRVRLPKIDKEIEELADPQVLLNLIIGSEVELPCLLAMWMSLRMSEIRGLMCSSIRDGFLFVEQTVVDVGTNVVRKKGTKTAKSRRRIRIPEYIMRLIADTEEWQTYIATGEDQPLIPHGRNYIYYHFTELTKRAGIEMSFHDLRSQFASISLSILQLPEKSVQATGGWSSDRTLKETYSRTYSNVQKEADEKRDEYFKNIFGDKNVERHHETLCKS